MKNDGGTSCQVNPHVFFELHKKKKNKQKLSWVIRTLLLIEQFCPLQKGGQFCFVFLIIYLYHFGKNVFGKKKHNFR